MVAPLESSLNASAYPKRSHLTKAGADTLYVSVATFAPILYTNGVPVSGGAGNKKGQLNLDTSQNPNIVYINVGDEIASSWMSLLSGNVV